MTCCSPVRPQTNLKDSKNHDSGVVAATVVKDEFMGNVSDGEGKIDELFGEARPGEGVGEVEDFGEDPEEDAEPKRVSADPGQPTQADIDDHNVDH